MLQPMQEQNRLELLQSDGKKNNTIGSSGIKENTE
jgi:hypothetical protein